MTVRAEQLAEERVDLEAEMNPTELAELRGAVAESDAHIERGETVPWEVVREGLRQIPHGG